MKKAPLDKKKTRAATNRAAKKQPFWTRPRSWRDYTGEFFIAVSVLLMTVLLRHPDTSVMESIGLLLTLALLLIILHKDIERYKPEFVKNPKNMLLIGVLLVSNLLLARIFYLLLEGFARGIDFLHPDAIIYGLPLATGAVLAALLIDVHVAIVIATITSLSASIWLQDYTYSFYTFIGSITGAFMVIQCKKRSAVLRGGLYISLASLAAALAVGLLKGTIHTQMGYSALVFSLINGIAVASMVSITLPVLENAFKITTDIRLVELLDLNQPLLRSFLLQAPGTYHHSIIVGNLAEAAAEAVGANPLLARVSAYYHDIGKVKTPDYFIENQQTMTNRHEKLSTTMSGLIIASHVKEGVELASAHNLPEPIVDIIREHHGTSLMTYFYEKAKNLHEPGTPPVNENDYRYPGPKPQTRVSALVMLADGVEAASRVLTDPTPARIAALVNKVTNKVFLDNQLDECELTLKDLQRIKNHFTFILTSIFHKRVNYPGMGLDDKSDQYSAKSQQNSYETAGTEDAKGAEPVKVVKS